VLKFVFSHSKLRKKTFAEIFKIQGSQGPPCPPFDAHGLDGSDSEIKGNFFRMSCMQETFTLDRTESGTEIFIVFHKHIKPYWFVMQ